VNIVSRKGGAGKTTMALLAARYLAEHATAPRVTLLDLDFSGTSLRDVLAAPKAAVAGETPQPLETCLLNAVDGSGWEALAADVVQRHRLASGRSFYYASSADDGGAAEDEEGRPSEALTLAGRRARDLVRARLDRLVRWVIDEDREHRDLVFLLDNSPGIRGLSRELLLDAFDTPGGVPTMPPQLDWVNVLLTTPDRQDVLASFGAWLEEWDHLQAELKKAGAGAAQAEEQAAKALLLIVNKLHEDEGDAEAILKDLLRAGVPSRGHDEVQIESLLDRKHLRVAPCASDKALAVLFRGREPKEVPQLDKYVPGFGTFLDALVPASKSAAMNAPIRRSGEADGFFTRRGNVVAIEPVEDGFAIGADRVGLGLQAPLWAKLLRRGCRRVLTLTDPDVEVYELPGEASKMLPDIRRDLPVRYANRLYRFDPKRPDALLVLTDRLFVRFTREMKRSQVDKYAAAAGIHLAEKLDSIPNGYLAMVKSGNPRNALQIANKLIDDKLVAYAEPDWVRTFANRSKPRFAEHDQWNHENRGQSGGTKDADMRVLRAWALGALGKGVTIAVIDEGIDILHPQLDLPGKLVHGLDLKTSTSDPRPRFHDEDHGTAVAGLALAARTDGAIPAAAGVAPAARLMPIRATEYLAEAGVYRAFVHARKKRADIVSCSWGPEEGRGVLDDLPQHVQEQIDLLASDGRKGLGIPVFFSAGNGNETTDTDGWASYDKVIAVASSDHHDRRVQESDFGRAIWVCAPSAPSDEKSEGKIPTLGLGESHVLFDGNSAACPQVAGVAALMLSANPGLHGADVREILKRTADPIDAGGHTFLDRDDKPRSTAYDKGSLHSPAYGYGRVNAEKAVLAARDWKAGSKE
jgi:subtilisin family serine protease